MRGERISVAGAMPADWRAGSFVGRIETDAGPSPVLVRSGQVYDMAKVAPTVSLLLEQRAFDEARGELLGPIEDLAFRNLLVPSA